MVFVSTGANSKPQGLCAVCAKELGITQVSDIMEKMGITDEMLEEASEQLSGLMGEDGENGLLSMLGANGEGNGEEDGDGFEMGGAPTMPQSLQELFGQKSEKVGEKSQNEKGDRKSPPRQKRKYVDAYTENLTRKARDGKLDRIIGRDAEIARTVQILSRRTKNNPCLIGEPGVGKTAIAEGLALRIAAGEVPLRLQNKEICLLDLTALVAGTQFRGQFESRIKGLIEEVRAAGNIILFIDEVHNLVGAGDSEGSMNAANILKPALSRGEIQVIGATTFTEYRKYIEKDAALERRFQPVRVKEPSVEDTVQVLIGIKEYYENYHRVTISDSLLREAVVLSERYVTDRFLPDKAIDLLDEACTCAALRNLKMRDYDAANMDLEKKEKEEEEMAASTDPIDYEQLAQLRAEIARLKQRTDALRPEALGAPVTEEDLARVLTLWNGGSRRKKSAAVKCSGWVIWKRR